MSKKNRIAFLVKQIKDIQAAAEDKGDNKSKYITDRCNVIAKKERERFNVFTDRKTGELTSKPSVSYRYYCQVMEDYRNAVKALGFKHHAINFHVKAFIQKYSSKENNLSKLLDVNLPIETLRENLILLRAEAITGSAYKKDLLKLKFEHHAFYMFEPKGAIKDWISDDNKKRLSKKLNNQVLVNPAWIKETAERLLIEKKPTVSELCMGIALATGRRLTEIMKTAEFKKVNDTTLLFSGQLKTKNRRLFEDLKPYKIPTMVKAEIVIKALKTLRKLTGDEKLTYNDVLGNKIESKVKDGDLKDYWHNAAIHKRYAVTVGAAIRSLMSSGHFSLKDCRAIYTEVTYENHSETGESRSAYRHRVLGHSLIETQLHYEAFQLDTTVDTIKFVEPEDDKKDSKKDMLHKDALLAYLESSDEAVNGYRRAPRIAIMHAWLKNEVAGGLLFETITPSYIRRYCLIDGKQQNLNTIKKYIEEFIKLDQFQPPKDEPKKPKNKNERKILELEERIEEMQDRTIEIGNEQGELKEEKREIECRMEEIDSECEELEQEQELLEEERDELQWELDELLAEQEKEQAEEPEEPKEKPTLTWPEPNEIDIKAVKEGDMWHVSANVNETYFEILVKGNKRSAIKEFKAHYKKEISK